MIIENRRDEGVRLYEDISPTMRAAWGTGGGNVPMILDDEIYSMANCDHTLTLYGKNVAPTLTSRMGTGGNQVPVFVEKDMVLNDQGGSSISVDNKSPTLRAEAHGNMPCVVDDKANTLRANAGAIKHMADLKGRTVIEGVNYQGCKSASNTFKDICPTLEATHGHDVHVIKQDSYCIAGNTIDRKIENGGNGAGFQKDISYTLNTIDRHAVSDVEPQIVGTLAAADSKGKNGQDINKFTVVESRIRRLTPLECERLQGLPDGWTDVPSIDKKGNIKPASDSSRYKAIGNGMAQPCADFVLEQLAFYTNNR